MTGAAVSSVQLTPRVTNFNSAPATFNSSFLIAASNIYVSKLLVPRTRRRLIYRRGFSLKKVRKTIPQKKIPQTDAIFVNVQSVRNLAPPARYTNFPAIQCLIWLSSCLSLPEVDGL